MTLNLLDVIKSGERFTTMDVCIMNDKKQVQVQKAEQDEICLSLQQQFYHFAHSQTTEHFYILFNSANHPLL